jgi:hypothetical protein
MDRRKPIRVAQIVLVAYRMLRTSLYVSLEYISFLRFEGMPMQFAGRRVVSRSFRVSLSLFIVAASWLIPVHAQERGINVIARAITGDENFDAGKQYAAIIAVDKYKEWAPLRGAVAEAKKVESALSDRYVIDQFFELYDENATSANIRRLFLETLPRAMGPRDSLLVFYAGHGYTDASNTGFWIACDGSSDLFAQNNWIPNSQLRNMIGELKAQRILILADACFSGDFLDVSRGSLPSVDSEYFRKALRLTARQVLSSGSSETVPDQSEFGRELVSVLERNEEPLLDPISIFNRVRLGMTKTLPLLGTLPGNEQGSSYVLFLKKENTAAAAPATTGSVAISAPKGAICYVDGSSAGVPASGTMNNVEPGARSLVFRKPGYRDEARSVTVEAGKVTAVDVSLERLKPARISFPTFGVGLGLRGDPGARQLSTSEGGASTWEVDAGVPVELAFTSPYADHLDLPPIEGTLGEGDNRVLADLPSGRISLPWLPEGTRVVIGGPNGSLALDNEGTSGYRSPEIPVGQYPVTVGSYFEGQVTVRPLSDSEPSEYRAAAQKYLDAERGRDLSQLAKKRTKTTVGWISFAVGVLGAAGTGAVYYLGGQASHTYETTSSLSAAQAAWASLQTYQALFPVAAAIGGVGLGGSALLLLGGPDPRVLQRSIGELDADIRALHN